MSRIVPDEYVLTDEAIDELVGADPHFRRLKAGWLAASGEVKNKAYVEVCERQSQITEQLVEAVKAHRLQSVALQRTAAGEWVEYGIPKRYRETLGGELSLWRGSAEKMELEPGDEWLRHAPLCFRRREFHEWLASAAVVRPVGAEDLPTWWTVPEAAVWIATRKLTAVQSLDLRARASLFIASEVVSGAYEASFELLAGLREGRLQALGWPRSRPWAAASQVIPSDFWKAPTEFSEGETGVEGLRGQGDAMVGLLLESDEVMAKWESPRSLLDGEKIPLGVAIGRLMNENLTAYLLRHAEVCVTGLNANGERVEVDRDVFRTNATIDRVAHSVRTADGRLHWSAVMVELRAATEVPAPPPASTDERFIAFDLAVRRVQRALCRKETIAGLTSRERWLVTLDYFDAELKDLGGEWQQALNRNDLWQHQHDEAIEWLKSRGFANGNGGLLDQVQFERVFASAFPALLDALQLKDTAKLLPSDAKRSEVGSESDAAKGGALDTRHLELQEWGTKVCQAVRSAGKRIGKGPFTSLAWRRFGTGSGLTVDAIGAAWTHARTSVGWPNAGTIPIALRIQDEELEKLASAAGLLGDDPLRGN